MCNGTWACFDCRLAVRRPAWRHVTAARPWLIGQIDEHVRCSRCHAAMRFLGPTIEIPPRHDERAWRQFHRQIAEHHARAIDERVLTLVRRRQALERRIREIESRPRSAGRAALAKRLRTELSSGAFHRDGYWIEGE